MMIKIKYVMALTMVLAGCVLHAQTSVSEKLLASAKAKMEVDPVFQNKEKGPKWTYDLGVLMEGATEVWRNSLDGDYFYFIQSWMDKYVDNDGNILNYSSEEYNIDHIKNGKTLLMLYKVTNKEKYLKACHLLFSQLENHPRTKEGGFWHKQVYPHQMWLDGLYMGQPFLAEYADLMDRTELFDDIANQFVLMERNARDAKTGLLYHGWDESREQKWSNPETGTSPHFWGRGMGWFAMALVDVLDYFPEEHARRTELLNILNRTLTAVVHYQDPTTGVWFDIVDLGSREGNYVESSASSMFVYALAKSIRKGYIPFRFSSATEKGYQGLLREFISENGPNKVNLDKTVQVSGLGGAKNYRDGSFEYYMSEPVISNDYKGIGPFLKASSEMEAYTLRPTKGRKVIQLDNFYNNEYKAGPSGSLKPYHYLWDGDDNNGFSLLGRVFEHQGASLETLCDKPTAKNLKKSDVYIIVDPDTEKETKDPNFMEEKEAEVIAKWVKKGGVLVLLLNDVGNCEITKFNTLSRKFGVTFNEDSRNRVQGKDFAMGSLQIPVGNEVFASGPKVYIKEISTLALSDGAEAVFSEGGDVIIAKSEYGKGVVFAVGDPWFYNEYIDGRKLPKDLQNGQATRDLVDWLMLQAK